MAKKQKKTNNLTYNHPDLRNAFNTLVANIRFAAIGSNVKTVAITSACENEGKTTVAVNLAAALVSGGKRVLIVDTDMRRRSIANAIGVYPHFGLYSVLCGRCKITEAISQTHQKNLFFLDCEANVPNPAVILSTLTFARLVDFCYKQFDYVIFDTPPVSTFVDAALVSAVTDATIVAIRQKETKKSQLKNTINQLRVAGANIVGTVFTFSEEATDNQYYYAYYNKEGKRISNKEDIFSKYISENNMQDNLSTWLSSDSDGCAVNRQRKLIAQENKNFKNVKNFNSFRSLDENDNQDSQANHAKGKRK